MRNFMSRVNNFIKIKKKIKKEEERANYSLGYKFIMIQDL